MTRMNARGVSLALVLLGMVATPAFGATSLTRTSSFAYDPTTGLLTQTVIEPGQANLSLETDYTYDAFGNKTQVTVKGADVASRTTTTGFDAQGRFPTSVTNALGQSQTQAFDQRFGLPTSQTGPNGLTTTWQYDSFGRKTLEVRPDGTQTSWTYTLCSGVAGGTASCPQYGAYQVMALVSTTAAPTTPIAPTITTTYDALGRPIQGDTQGFDGSTIRQVTQYNASGQVAQASRPFFVNSGTPVYTSFTYDAVSRVVTRTDADGSTTSYAYHGLTTSVTNALGQTTTTVRNSQGEVASVTDPANHVSTFAYDPFGDPVSSSDPAGNTTTATYDLRGRKIAQSDADRGAWSYAYDTLGEMVSQTDAKGQTTTMSYDVLGRPLQKVSPDLTSSWTYDTAAHGIGKLAMASASSGYQRSYSYDALSRPVQTSYTYGSGGTAYSFNVSYDADGRMAQVVYPSGFTADYGYTASGYLATLTDDGSKSVLWQANARDAELHLTQFTYGNNVATTKTYDPKTGRLQSVAAMNASGAVLQSDAYQWDSIGNLASRSDNVNNVSESFQYDTLDRLTQATVANYLTWTIGYDASGNITSRSDLGTYGYGAQPHAVTSVSGLATTYSYDANGNLTSATLNGSGWRQLTWTASNLPASITEGGIAHSYLYGPEAQRFRQQGPDGTRDYYDDGVSGVRAERLTASGTGQITWTNYLMVPGEGMIGIRSEPSTGLPTTRWYHKDNLGSVQVLSDESGNGTETDSYDAWGARRYANGHTNDGQLAASATIRGFAGQEQLGIGLVDMNARFYDPQIGRFMSPDPMGGSPGDPQSFNPYSYVGNNPLSRTDPTGLCFFGCFWKPVFHAVGQAVKAIQSVPVVGPVLNAAVAAAACGPGAPACVAAVEVGATAFEAGVTSGKLSVVLEAGAIAGAESAAFFEVGSLANYGGTWAGALANPGAYAANVAGHGAIGCAVAAASGGDCGPGALSAAISAAAAPIVAGRGFIAGEITSATIGGLTSVASGGKFANGAETAAYGYLFSQVAQQAVQGLAIGVNGQQGLDDGSLFGQLLHGFDWIGNQAQSTFDDLAGVPSQYQTAFGTNSYACSNSGCTNQFGVPLLVQVKTPNTLAPFSVYTNPGSGQVRWYDENGKPLMDMDYDHNHLEIGSPHNHTWSNGVRGPATSIAPFD